MSLALVPQDCTDLALTPQQKATALDRMEAAQAVIDEFRARCKAELRRDPNAVPGWRLARGKKNTEITDPGRVFERFQSMGGSYAQFTPAIKITKSGLEDAIRTVTGAKGQALKTQVESAIEGATFTTITEPSLSRIK